MNAKDQILVRKTLAGDSEAFGDLVERYNRLVHGVILHKVRRPDEVEDLVQDVFCKAYQELPSLREPGKFPPGWRGWPPTTPRPGCATAGCARSASRTKA